MFDHGSADGGGDETGASSLLTALAVAGTAVAEVAGHAAERAWASSPTERVRAIEELARVRRVAEAAHLALVRSIGDPDAGALPALGAALGAGEVSLAHVDVAVRALDRLPSALRREHAGAVDAFLAQQSRAAPASASTWPPWSWTASTPSVPAGASTPTPSPVATWTSPPTPPGWSWSAASSTPPRGRS